MHRKEFSHFGKKGHGNRGRKGNKDDESVHRRNLHVFAQPVVFLFNILGFLAYHFWLLISAVCTSARALPQKSKQTSDHLETDNSSQQREDAQVREGTGMFPYTYGMGEKPVVVGPAEPALAKQKHHHRKAFEYISKALKIDEEEKGTVFGTITQVFLCKISFRFRSSLRSRLK